ncbi:hypothetical protein JVX90_00215 [Gordonia sp. PDNC005]|uniref:hypothetical protein n=1 Tax=Gordonia sp. PDNC005 TaxID=2811424 RepID=UPI00196415AF|nr:hypothetical protein [Gordonia sp. PDNC005]QRY62736.1 hypothetical protein JVX90_00215 [Gordonia sp. PDNC005]
MGDANTSARVQIPRAEQQAEWLDDYIAGLSERAVAAKHGVSKTAVHNAIHNQLAAARERRAELADHLYEIQARRYEHLWTETARALADAKSNREVGVAQLITAGRGVLDSLTRLHGLDQPTRVDVTVTEISDVDRELADLADMVKKKAIADATAAGIDAPDLPVLDAIIESVTEE